jgi:exodeoxyribonuclease VII small subunit
LNFEEALKQLTRIVDRLESEEIGLEESLTLFEKGISLSRHCSETLEKAELKVEQVNQTYTD